MTKPRKNYVTVVINPKHIHDNRAFKSIPTIEEEEDCLPVVTKEWSDKRRAEQKNNQLWEGFVSTIMTRDRKYMKITLHNKYRMGDFFEEWKYPVEQYKSDYQK